MDFPLLPGANRFCGCFCLGSGPVFVPWCFCAFCFAFSAGETQVWLGDLRVVAFCVVVVVVSLFWFNRFADFKDCASLYRVFAAYSHVRTEPLARHRPSSRKKKVIMHELRWYLVIPLANYPFHPWTGTCHVTVFVVWGVFCLVCLFWVCVFLCFCVLLVFGVLVCVVSVCFLVMTCDSKQDYVSVLHQFTFEATLPQTAYAWHN